MDVVFAVTLCSPLGPKNGKLALWLNGDTLQGTFSMFGAKNPIEGGDVYRNTYVFTGSIATAAGKRDYKATVSIEGDTLNGEVVFYLRTIPVKIPLLIPMKLTGERST